MEKKELVNLLGYGVENKRNTKKVQVKKNIRYLKKKNKNFFLHVVNMELLF
jgi:hypothetical protein